MIYQRELCREEEERDVDLEWLRDPKSIKSRLWTRILNGEVT